MDATDRKARRARLRLAGAAIVVLGVLAAGGYLAVDSFNGDGDEPSSANASGQPSASSSSPAASAAERMTPGKAQALPLLAPKKAQDGAPLGFPENGLGAISAAVAYWEEYSWLDDSLARKQLGVLVSPDSPQTIDKQISEIHRVREGIGLPPSGPAPADVTFTTVVTAVRGKSMVKDGSVVQIWLQYDRYATQADGGGDDSPLKNQTVDVIMKWQNGEWRITQEPQYVKLRKFPVAYDPNSVPARQDGWWRVSDAN
ncbi:hypothetical protein [Streptomyces chartreusis]|uniref:Uncharacterized protein n=1 Tax=Streptomyces chartreusis TaxID=1969 RepID=A0A7H8TAD3_STRCX|nr:hypothetical protein [Streptomyces chartreusis]QKZ20374.1 hypothetical protein HUT05_25305 [Streptomyces chartreusis]